MSMDGVEEVVPLKEISEYVCVYVRGGRGGV